MTYEASIEMSEESGLEQIDEDEWTDRNFGNSTANDVNTSDDSISDLESDDDDERGIKVINLMILQSVFFNWASPEFAKCWPANNQFQKNVRVPDWPPL